MRPFSFAARSAATGPAALTGLASTALLLALTRAPAPSDARAQRPGPSPASTGLTVRHDPNPAPGRRSQDRDGSDIYRWVYRTTVRNDTSQPLRITGFAVYAFRDGSWINWNADQRTFTGEEFLEWYTAADSLPGGWLQPGAEAADANNWVRTYDPEPPRCKWVYTAEDESGRECSGEAEIEPIPFVEDQEFWAGVDPSRLVEISIRIDSEGPLAYAQARLTRTETGWSLALYAAATTSTPTTPTPPGAATADRAAAGDTETAAGIATSTTSTDLTIQAAAPGLYRLALFCAGHDPVEVPLLLAPGDSDVSLVIRPMAHGSAGTATVTYDASHRHLDRLRRIEASVSARRKNFEAALVEREQSKNDEAPLDFDWTSTVDLLAEAMEVGNPEPVRAYAACQRCRVAFTPLDSAVATEILELLPPDSPYWAALPGLTLRMNKANEGVFGIPFLESVAASNPDRVVRALALSGLALQAKSRGDAEASMRYYDRLADGYADLRESTFALRALNASNHIQPGRGIPDFALMTIDGGREVTRQSLLGKVYLLHFWATWCGPCKAEMGELHAAFEKHHGEGFSIVSVSMDRSRDDVDAFRERKWSMPWDNVVAEGTLRDEVAKTFEVFALPHLVLVGPDGVILAVDEELRGARLETTLAEHVSGGR
jgi:thiol-disulfide isomerase/thioredoxin